MKLSLAPAPVLRTLFAAFIVAVLMLMLVAGSRYEGNWAIYILFTLAANALLFNGFRKQALFFDTFIGVFLWLGFWLKLSVRVAFSSGIFHESVGAFDGSAGAFDRALLISSCGLAAFLVASLVRERLFIYATPPPSCDQSALFRLYRGHRKLVVSTFMIAVAAVVVSNVWLGIYQRGMVIQTILPYGLNGVYKWLLQFGLASVSALIIRFEIEIQRNLSLFAIFPPLIESFLSNVSLLSRGMILNASALGYGGLRLLLAMKQRIDVRMVVLAGVLFAVLFLSSVYLVNYLRSSDYLGFSATAAMRFESASNMTLALFVDRWVGIEGVMAVSSSDRLGWELWREAWQERFVEGVPSLYDRYFVDSPYTGPNVDRTRFHFVSLPGVIAFFFFPNSMIFLFLSLMALAWAAAGLEVATYRFCGRNWVLCALFGQVIAFRFTSFGYVPSQSHLYFGALVLNVVIIFAAELLVRYLMAARPRVG